MSSRKDRSDLLNFTDDKYLLEAARIDDNVSLQRAEINERNKKRRNVFRAVSLSAACFLVIFGITLMPRIFTGLNGETSGGEVDNSDLPVVDDRETPWENGGVSLVSVTFKPSERATAFSLPLEFLSNKPYKTKNLNSSSSPFTTKGSPEVDNVKISIMSDTKISSFIGGDLIKISAQSGEHEDCDGVYYDIREDKTVCMSCEILSRIRTSPYYIDAYIRSIVEECLITPEYIFASMADGAYEEFYTALDNDIAKAFLMTDEKPSVESLGIAEVGSIRSVEAVDRALLLHKRPIIKIVEYGYNVSRLTFTISSAYGSGFWGAFVYDLDENTFKKIDGETVGLPYCTNGYLTTTPEELVTLDLSLATGITISDDYNTIIATVPYFLNELYEVGGTFVPVYLADNIVVFNVADGTYNALLGNSSAYDASVSYPLDIARELYGVYYYPTVNNTWAFHCLSHKYELKGEFVKLERVGNDIYAIMKNANEYQFYLLGGNNADLTPMPDGVMLYAVESGERIDLRTLERTTLFEGEPKAMAMTKDGRFIYLYFEGESEIVCIDAKYGTSGTLPLSDEFVSQSVGAGNVSYLLFLNSDEDKLLMAYYKNGSLVFDREGYLADGGASASTLNPEGAAREYLDEAFERNMSSVFEHYYFQNKKITIKKNDNVMSLAKLVLAARVDDYIKNNGSLAMDDIKALFAELGETLAPYFEFSGNTASVSASLVSRLSGGQSTSEINEAFEYYLLSNIPSDMTVEFQTREPMDEVTRSISNGFLRLIYGYWAEVETAVDADEIKLFNELNKNVDSAWIEARVKIEPIVRAELEKILTEENGYCISSEKITAAVQASFPRVIEAATGIEYSEYVRTGAFLDNALASDFFSMRAAEAGCVPEMSVKHGYDKEKLKAFLSALTFEEGEKEITVTATLTTEWGMGLVPFSYYKYRGNDIVEVGRASDGGAYAVISGHYAALTDGQYDGFIAMINDSERFVAWEIYDSILNELFHRR